MNFNLLDPFHSSQSIDTVECLIELPINLRLSRPIFYNNDSTTNLNMEKTKQKNPKNQTFFFQNGTSLAFSRHGKYLAVGTSSGAVLIIDFTTRGIIRTLLPPTNKGDGIKHVCSVRWNRRGSELIATWSNGFFALFRIENDDRLYSIPFSTQVEDIKASATSKKSIVYAYPIMATYHPKDSTICLICAQGSKNVFVLDLSSGTRTYLDLQEEKDIKGSRKNAQTNRLALFSPKGDAIYVTDAKGATLMVHSYVKDKNVQVSFQKKISLPSKVNIKSIEFHKNGNILLLNCADRSIKIYNIETSSFTSEFQEPVNRYSWQSCCFSGDGEYVIGGTTEKHDHQLYIWTTSGGHLMKPLNGQKESLLTMAYHPLRSYLAVCTAEGHLYVWNNSSAQAANWCAFAPNFTELDENEEYIEREDEFDLNVEDKNTESSTLATNDPEDYVETIKTTHCQIYASDNSDEEDDMMISVVPFEEELVKKFNKRRRIG